jgi:hypothetical protein
LGFAWQHIPAERSWQLKEELTGNLSPKYSAKIRLSSRFRFAKWAIG